MAEPAKKSVFKNIRDVFYLKPLVDAFNLIKSMSDQVNEDESNDTIKIAEESGLSAKEIKALRIEEDYRKKLEEIVEYDLENTDKDGYNKIPDKVSKITEVSADIKGQISKVKASEDNNRAKGGRQKTRVDED